MFSDFAFWGSGAALAQLGSIFSDLCCILRCTQALWLTGALGRQILTVIVIVLMQVIDLNHDEEDVAGGATEWS